MGTLSQNGYGTYYRGPASIIHQFTFLYCFFVFPIVPNAEYLVWSDRYLESPWGPSKSFNNDFILWPFSKSSSLSKSGVKKNTPKFNSERGQTNFVKMTGDESKKEKKWERVSEWVNDRGETMKRTLKKKNERVRVGEEKLWNELFKNDRKQIVSWMNEWVREEKQLWNELWRKKWESYETNFVKMTGDKS